MLDANRFSVWVKHDKEGRGVMEQGTPLHCGQPSAWTQTEIRCPLCADRWLTRPDVMPIGRAYQFIGEVVNGRILANVDALPDGIVGLSCGRCKVWFFVPEERLQ